MAEWNNQIFFEDVLLDAELESVSIPLTLQRMVMEAGANRDLSSIHHDDKAAVATGAPGVYMNTFFIMGVIERLLRQWMGLEGQIKKIGPMRMKVFNCVGDTILFKGKVREKIEENGLVVLDVWSETRNGESVSAEATVCLPRKN